MNLYVAEHANDKKKALGQLNQECGEEEIDEVEEFEIENSIEILISPQGGDPQIPLLRLRNSIKMIFS